MKSLECTCELTKKYTKLVAVLYFQIQAYLNAELGDFTLKRYTLLITKHSGIHTFELNVHFKCQIIFFLRLAPGPPLVFRIGE